MKKRRTQSEAIILARLFAEFIEDMDGKRRLAPWSSRAESGMGPVLTAMVNTPDATPACTPRGAFSMTMELLGESRLGVVCGSDSVLGWKC